MKLRVRPARRLTGHTEVPGDKSISHRAALLGALAEGVTKVQGYLEAEDCLKVASALGASCVRAVGTTPGVFTRSECEEFLGEHALHIERL